MPSPAPPAHKPLKDKAGAHPGHCPLTRCKNSVRSFFLFRHRAAATLFFSRRRFLRSSSSSSCGGKKPRMRHRGKPGGRLPSQNSDRRTTNPHSATSEPPCQPAGLSAGGMQQFPAGPQDACRAGGHPGEESVPQEGRAARVLPEFRRPGAWRSPHSEVTPNRQSVPWPGAKPLGTVFQASGSQAFPFKTP